MKFHCKCVNSLVYNQWKKNASGKLASMRNKTENTHLQSFKSISFLGFSSHLNDNLFLHVNVLPLFVHSIVKRCGIPPIFGDFVHILTSQTSWEVLSSRNRKLNCACAQSLRGDIVHSCTTHNVPRLH